MSAGRTQVAILAEAAVDVAPLASALRAGACDVAVHSLNGHPEPTVPTGTEWVLVSAATLTRTLADLRTLRDDLAHARAELEERKLVERAKGLLMTRRGLSEPDAYRTLQKMAMDRKRKLADIARNVLDFAELLGGPNDPTR